MKRRHGRGRRRSSRLHRWVAKKVLVPFQDWNLDRTTVGLIGAVAVIVAGGGAPLWASALAMMAVGLMWWRQPPKEMPNGWVVAGVVLLAGATLAGLMVPAGWVEDARRAADRELGLAVSPVLSLQPLVTAETAGMLLLGLLAWLLALDSRPTQAGRRQALRLVVGAGAMLGLVVLLGNTAGIRWNLAPESPVFSFFPNKNQTGTVLALGALLGVGLAWQELTEKKDGGFVALVFSGLMVLALFATASRAALLFFFLGLLVWSAGLGLTGRGPSFLKLGLPLAILVFGIFLLFGEQTRERLMSQMSDLYGGEVDFRVALWRDTWSMWLERPWLGYGLGNFEAGFPVFREDSLRHDHALHPDSDFFWVLAELGLVGLAGAGLVAWGTLRHLWPEDWKRTSVERVVVFTALVVFLLNAVVDVPAHRLGTLFFAAVLVAMAGPGRKAGIKAGREKPAEVPAPRREVFWLVRLPGAALGLGGLFWLAGWAAGLPWHTTQQEAWLEKGIARAVEDPGQPWPEAGLMVAGQPHHWRSYFQRARLTLMAGGSVEEAAADYRRARHLNPFSRRMVGLEAETWLGVEPLRALAAWRELLRRPLDPPYQHQAIILGAFQDYPELRVGILELSRLDPGLRVGLLLQLRDPDFRREISLDLAQDPGLEGYTPEQRRQLLRHWAAASDPVELHRFLEGRGETLPESWEIRAVAMARQGNLLEAIRAVRDAYSRPPIPGLGSREGYPVRLEREYQANPNDLVKGSTLLSLQVEDRRWPQALQTLKLMTRNPDAPSYCYYWLGEILYMQEDLPASWRAFDQFLQMRAADR